MPYENELIDISTCSDNLIRVDMKYFQQNIVGAINKAFVRQEVADMLMKVARSLPMGIHLKIWDAWRPRQVQLFLYQQYELALRRDYPNLSEQELTDRVLMFVSSPYGEYLHGTGGAVDVTLMDDDGNELPMGSDFDEFGPSADINYYKNKNEIFHANRMILYNAMLQAGFVNYPSEWWHYDYGDRIWSQEKNEPVKYKVCKGDKI